MPTQLHKFLTAKNWKNAFFARMVGVDRTTISKLRSGTGFTSPEVAARIEAITGGRVQSRSLLRRKKNG